MEREATPAEQDQMLRNHALDVALRVHSIQQQASVQIAMSADGMTMVRDETAVAPRPKPLYIPSVDAILADATKIYNFLKVSGEPVVLETIGGGR